MKKIFNFEEWLNEQQIAINEDSGNHSYGCAMAYFELPEMDAIHKKIDEKDIYTDDSDRSYGLETEPHVTLLYGIHDKEVEDDKVLEACRKYQIGEIVLHNVSLFENDKYDVLKFDVRYPYKGGAFLHKINKELTKLPNTNSFPDYHPHCTIAYLKPGEGKKYVKMFEGLEINVKPNEIVYSKADGEKIVEKLA
jgi:2'-5' RNA ligase